MNKENVYGNMQSLPEAKRRQDDKSTRDADAIYNNFLKPRGDGKWNQQPGHDSSRPGAMEFTGMDVWEAPPRPPKAGQGISIIDTKPPRAPKIGLDLSSPAVEAAFRSPEGPAAPVLTSSGNASGGRRPTLVLSALLGISFLVCIGLICMALLNDAKLSEELKMSTAGHLENRSQISKDLADFKKDQEKFRSDTDRAVMELKKTIEAVCKSCPEGWWWFQKSCYYFSSTDRTWESAKQFCLNYGSHLVIINNQEEQKYLDENRSNKVNWIGFSDSGKEREWLWVDGSTASFTFWNEGEPNDMGGAEDCATLLVDGKWNDRHCSSNSRWICEKRWVC